MQSVHRISFIKTNGAITIGCTGFDGGEMQNIVDINLHVPAYRGEYGPVEDIFTLFTRAWGWNEGVSFRLDYQLINLC